MCNFFWPTAGLSDVSDEQIGDHGRKSIQKQHLPSWMLALSSFRPFAEQWIKTSTPAFQDEKVARQVNKFKSFNNR
jgi:hypothetical protein